MVLNKMCVCVGVCLGVGVSGERLSFTHPTLTYFPLVRFLMARDLQKVR